MKTPKPAPDSKPAETSMVPVNLSRSQMEAINKVAVASGQTADVVLRVIVALTLTGAK